MEVRIDAATEVAVAPAAPAGGGPAVPEWWGEHEPDLEARIAELDRPDYDDPARRDLTALDWVALIGFIVAVCVVSLAWGY